MNIPVGYDIMAAHVDDAFDIRSNIAWRKWTNGLNEQIESLGHKDMKSYLYSIENEANNAFRRSTVHTDVVNSGLRNVSSIRAVSTYMCIFIYL